MDILPLISHTLTFTFLMEISPLTYWDPDFICSCSFTFIISLIISTLPSIFTLSLTHYCNLMPLLYYSTIVHLFILNFSCCSISRSYNSLRCTLFEASDHRLMLLFSDFECIHPLTCTYP